MLTLALDTSTSKGGVAVLRGENVLSRAVWTREKSHSELVTPTIDRCLEDAGVDIGSIEQIAVGIGPGSFTGIRIAVNAARSLAYALGIKILAFDSTEILCEDAKRTDLPVLTLLNAHKNLLYVSAYEFDPESGFWKRTQKLTARSAAELEKEILIPHLCIGDGYLEYEALFSTDFKQRLVRNNDTSDFPLPEVLGRMAKKWRGQRRPLDWKELQALYIRASGAEEKLREGRGDER